MFYKSTHILSSNRKHTAYGKMLFSLPVHRPKYTEFETTSECGSLRNKLPPAWGGVEGLGSSTGDYENSW